MRIWKARFGFLLVPVLLAAQGLDYVKSQYTKYEYMVPMRDGVRLFTSVYVPKDASQKYPILFTRTPYSVAPSEQTSTRRTSGPRNSLGKMVTFSCTRMSAGGSCPKASSWMCARTCR